ncbi:MAG: rhodanese-like domain-containing protein [Nannocystaceae bacterium]
MPRRSTFLDLAALVGLAAVLAALRLAAAADLAWVADEPDVLESCALADEALADDPGEVRLAGPSLPGIAAADAVAMVGQPGVTFVDARGGDRYAAGHIPGALCLPAADAAALVAQQTLPIPPDDLVIAYCESPREGEAQALGRLLREHLGCQEVRVLRGGYDGWLAVGGPLTQEPERG